MAFMGLTAVAKANGIKSRFLVREARTLDDKILRSRTLQTCNLDEGLVNCDTTSRSCYNFEIESCTIYCIDNGSCEGANIKNSSVFCQSSWSCTGATIADSNVECSDYSSCDGAKILRSSVHCASESGCANTAFTACEISCGDDFQSCAFAEFNDQCSCSDNADYWMSVVQCTVNGAPSEEFCSTQSAGVTCATLGNPICSGMPGYPAPTTETSEPVGTMAPAASPHLTEPTFNSQSDEATQESEPPLDSGKAETNIVAIIVPVVVAVIGLVAAVVNRKKIVHVYNHHIVGKNTNSSTNA